GRGQAAWRFAVRFPGGHRARGPDRPSLLRARATAGQDRALREGGSGQEGRPVIKSWLLVALFSNGGTSLFPVLGNRACQLPLFGIAMTCSCPQAGLFSLRASMLSPTLTLRHILNHS